MHYCFFTTGSWEGNAAFLRPAKLGTALINRGVQVSYIVDDVPYNRTKLDLHPDANTVFVSSPSSVKQFWNRRRLLKELNPDYLDLLNAQPKTFATVFGTSHRIVGEWDEPPVLKDLGRARNVMFRVLNRWLIRRADIRVAITRFLQDWLKTKFERSSHYIPHAGYLPVREDGLSPFNEPTAVYLGNLFSSWDHDITFEAARLLKSQGKTPRILLMGGGPDLEKWRTFLAEHDLQNVSLPGFVSGEQMWRSLRHAHVLLFPVRNNDINKSRLPSKVFAYAQARRPIITSEVGEVANILGHHDGSPIYVDPTPEDFAAAIDSAMSAPRAPDVDYHMELHTYDDRAERLLRAIAEFEATGKS